MPLQPSSTVSLENIASNRAAVLERPACDCTSPNLWPPDVPILGRIVLPKDSNTSLPSELGSGTLELIWKKGLCGGNDGEDLEMRSSWMAQGAPKSSDCCP